MVEKNRNQNVQEKRKIQFLKKSRNATILEKTSWKRAQEKKLEKLQFATNSGKNMLWKRHTVQRVQEKKLEKIQFLTNPGKNIMENTSKSKGAGKEMEKTHVNRNTGKHQLWKKTSGKT